MNYTHEYLASLFDELAEAAEAEFYASTFGSGSAAEHVAHERCTMISNEIARVSATLRRCQPRHCNNGNSWSGESKHPACIYRRPL